MMKLSNVLVLIVFAVSFSASAKTKKTNPSNKKEVAATKSTKNEVVNCSEIEKPFVYVPKQQARLIVDPRQEVIFDGGNQTPRILMIDSVGTKDRPRLNVMTGLQVLENGNMKSYPHRISIKMPIEERGMAPKVVQVVFAPTDKDKKIAVAVQIEYLKMDEKTCHAAAVADFKP
jgi:hypothetical protein